MTELREVTVETTFSDNSKIIFYNPAFEPESGNEDDNDLNKGLNNTESKPANSPGWRSRSVMRLDRPSCVYSSVVMAASIVLLVTALGLCLVLILMQVKDQSNHEELTVPPLDVSTGGFISSSPSPTLVYTTADLHPLATPDSPLKCGGVLTDPDGTFSSPNHPAPYPPDALCVWVIQVHPPALVQLRVSSLGVEGPSPCLFDWLEVREERDKTSHITRFCGKVAPPTINTNSSTVWVTFHSDNSIGGSGFTAQYQAILPQQKSCSRDELLCDGGRCMLPVSVCDGRPDCQDQSDEANCGRKHKECGEQKRGVEGSLYSPNHPKPYPHQQLCTWKITATPGHVIRLKFHNFSLEIQDMCEFDYVEVHDGENTGDSNVLGRYCGTELPPELTSSGPLMTVLFVADEGVSDSGFFASYQAVNLAAKTCSTVQFACGTGECVHQDWLCDGWFDCTNGADEDDCANTTYQPFTSSCEPVQVEMCQGLSYNFTSFPNIWLSITDQQEAATVLRQYRILTGLACFQSLRRLVCGTVVPQCSPQGGVLQPCRSVCVAAQQQCSQALELLSLSWPFNCLLFPEPQDGVECALP